MDARFSLASYSSATGNKAKWANSSSLSSHAAKEYTRHNNLWYLKH